MVNMTDPALRPGPRGRAVRRWRAAKDAVVVMGPDRWLELEVMNEMAAKGTAAAASSPPPVSITLTDRKRPSQARPGLQPRLSRTEEHMHAPLVP